MDTTDGLRRGQSVRDTGAPISVPVGRKVLGRIINVIGEPVDDMGPIFNENEETSFLLFTNVLHHLSSSQPS